jgi:hypothetical protein
MVVKMLVRRWKQKSERRITVRKRMKRQPPMRLLVCDDTAITVYVKVDNQIQHLVAA